MKTVTSRDLAEFGPTYEAWQAEEFFGRPFTPKPRRRIVQVEPQRIRAGYFVDQELVVGQPRTSWWANPWHQLGIVLLIIAALFVIVTLGGGRFELP